MLRSMMKSKVHRATVTEADLHYVGSLTLDRDLMDAADILPHEKVQVVNITGQKVAATGHLVVSGGHSVGFCGQRVACSGQ